jgi:hypothetical protein
MMRSPSVLLPLLVALALAGCTARSAAEIKPGEQATIAPRAADATKTENPAPPPAVARPAEPVKSVTFDDIKLDLKKGDPFDPALLTPKVKQLDGKLISVRGYILPSFQQAGIKQFVLVRDNQECCFGPGAAIYDCILVEMKPGNTADFTIRPIAVEGKFNVREFDIDGKDLAIYQMDGESAQ